jgi:hypothetical protein
MAKNKDFPLTLTIKAVDNATGALKEINAQIKNMPIVQLKNKLGDFGKDLGLPGLGKSIAGVGSALSNVGSTAAALGLKIAGLAGAAAFGFYRIVKGAVDAGDKLNEMSKRVGLSVDAYASLQYAAAQADVSQEEFNGAMDKFNRNLGDAKAGGGALLTFLKKVAPGLATQVKGTKNTEQALSLMTDAMERVKDPARRAALAGAAFGKSGLQMGQFLGQGSKAIQEFQRRFIELAGSQEESAKSSDDADNALRDLETSFLGLRSAAAGQLLPALTELAKALSGIVAGNRGDLKQWATETGASISKWVKSGGLTQLVTDLKELSKTVGGIIDALGGLKGVMIGVAGFMAADFLMSVVKLGGSLLSLGASALPVAVRGFLLLQGALEGVNLVMIGFAAAPFVLAAVGIGAAAYQIYQNWQPLKEFFVDLWDSVILSFRSGWSAVEPIIKAMAMVPGFGGLKLAGMAGDAFAGQTTFQDRLQRPDFQVRRPGAQAQRAPDKAHITIDVNAPAGTRARIAPASTADVDMSLGHALGAP